MLVERKGWPMKTTIQAVYEKGVLRPVDKVNLRENQVLSLTFDTVELPDSRTPGPRRVAGKDLLDLVGLFPPEDMKEIEEAVQDCRQVDADGW